MPEVRWEQNCVRPSRRTWPLLAFSWLVLTASAVAAPSARKLAVSDWRLVERESGKVNYYSVQKAATPPFIHAEYRPPYKTAVMGYQLADADRASASKLRWSWRALKLPKAGDECVAKSADSAAVIYVTWKRGLRWYTLKYVWSSVGAKGAICDRKRNPFLAQQTVVLQSGGPLNVWKQESIDLKAEFRKHFEDGDANASVPDLLGIGLMSDGDQTQSESSADYADFVLER
ncbi:MAG TPA: DUF3047 domain-containing protein [Polyangiaceae bacterium]|nr:DUF3047 domain-containing protein [Polyangiaceae bacterium]